jgi:aryl-alcohol dehydrogenase-like predicted oxidoreductase
MIFVEDCHVFQKKIFQKNLELIDKLTTLAKKKECTSSQLTLAWILVQDDDFFIIPGTSKIKNLEENIAAAQVKLNKEEIQEIREFCEQADISSERN